MKLFKKVLIFIGAISASLQSVEASQEEYSFSNEETKYLGLDNNTFVSREEIMDDPFIHIRAESNLTKGYETLAAYPIVPSIGSKPCKKTKKPISLLRHRQNEENTLMVFNNAPLFDYRTPEFLIVSKGIPPSQIYWEISNDPHFTYVPVSLSRTEQFTTLVRLDPIAETFFNNDESYYFRVKSSINAKWSAPFEFRVKKPEGIADVEFEKLEEDLYEINWERYAEEKSQSIEYLIFGSNSLDFIPSIYSDVQINEMLDGKVTEQDRNDNLVAVTTDTKTFVPGTLAYYRIIVREEGQLSVPSRLIQVYDVGLVQPRNVLQLCEDDKGRQVAKRVLIPSTYPWTETSLPRIQTKRAQKSLFDIKEAAFSSDTNPGNYVYNTYVPQDIWDKVKPYFLPENHPAKSKLDRMFSSKRIIQSPDTFKKAGFARFRPGKFSRIMASSHEDLKDYFIKAFSDEELRIIADWMKFIHRIKGASTIRACIKEHGYQKYLKVPRKWIYPLPMSPSPPRSTKFLRKNFILVAENMDTVGSEKNRKMYKEKMTKTQVEALFKVFYEAGLWDSVFAFNVPFCKDGKLAFIDTEYHHKWPVPFHRMSKYFSSEINSHWLKLAKGLPERPEGK